MSTVMRLYRVISHFLELLERPREARTDANIYILYVHTLFANTLERTGRVHVL